MYKKTHKQNLRLAFLTFPGNENLSSVELLAEGN